MIPKVVKMDVYPVAGHDSMELNLSGAHAPYFTRNVVVLEDSQGNLGVGEVPGGQKITKALEDVKDLVLGCTAATSSTNARRTAAGCVSSPARRTTRWRRSKVGRP